MKVKWRCGQGGVYSKTTKTCYEKDKQIYGERGKVDEGENRGDCIDCSLYWYCKYQSHIGWGRIGRFGEERESVWERERERERMSEWVKCQRCGNRWEFTCIFVPYESRRHCAQRQWMSMDPLLWLIPRRNIGNGRMAGQTSHTFDDNECKIDLLAAPMARHHGLPFNHGSLIPPPPPPTTN